MKNIAIVLCCFVLRVKCDDGYEFLRPSSVVKVPIRIQSTDQLTPLKVNVPSEAKPFTTGAGVLLSPTPVNEQLQTTAVARPGLGSGAPVRNQITTTFAATRSDSPLVYPSPVLNGPATLETGAGNPLIINFPAAPPLITTSVLGDDAITPTAVILNIGTKPVELAQDKEPILPASTGTVPLSFIEPSQVSIDIDRSVTSAQTSQSEQPIQVSSTKFVNDPITQNAAPCKCKFHEENPNPALGFALYDNGNALTPQLLTPEGSNPVDQGMARPPFDIRPIIVSLQLNLFVNAIPVLAANAVPLYF